MPGKFVISLDFELRWGVLERDLGSYSANLYGAREAIPEILRLFVRHKIHATWAVVGLLCCVSRDHIESLLPPQMPAYRDPWLSTYSHLKEIGRDEADDPLHYAPSLVQQIAAQPGQFLGTHTFSHFYCLEPGQTVEDFRADLGAATAAMAHQGLVPASIVFPRNQVNNAYLGVCREAGISVYRGAQAGWHWQATRSAEQIRLRRAARLIDSYLPVATKKLDCAPEIPGVCNIRGSRFLAPYRRRFRRAEPLRLHRIRREMRRAAARGEVYHLWWHPHNFGLNRGQNMEFLESVLVEFGALRRDQGMVSASMEEAAGLITATSHHPTGTDR